MKNKNRNSLMYISTVIVVIIVYLVIYLFGMSIRKNILDENTEYQNNPVKQPTNNIMSHKDNNGCHDNGNNNHNCDNGKDNNKIEFEYENDEGNYIDLNNQFPTKDEDGKNFVGDKYTQDFKLKFNQKARGVSYTITAEKLEESDLENTWIKAYLESDGIGISNCFRENGRIKTMDEYADYKSNPNEKILYQGIVSQEEAKRGYKNFTFRMWISEDVKVYNEEYPTKTVKVKINVYAQREY